MTGVAYVSSKNRRDCLHTGFSVKSHLCKTSHGMTRVLPSKHFSQTIVRRYEHARCCIFSFSIRLPHKHTGDDDAIVDDATLKLFLLFACVRAASKNIVSIERPRITRSSSPSNVDPNNMLDISSINSSSTLGVFNVDDNALNECMTASLPMFTVVFPTYKLAFVV